MKQEPGTEVWIDPGRIHMSDMCIASTHVGVFGTVKRTGLACGDRIHTRGGVWDKGI